MSKNLANVLICFILVAGITTCSVVDRLYPKQEEAAKSSDRAADDAVNIIRP